MKALIISDIHSNVHALEAVYEQEKDCDVIYCTGDLVDIGPFPKEVIQWVREHNVQCVQGNHDQTVIELYRNNNGLHNLPVEELLWKHHNAMQLNEADIAFLESLPEHMHFEIDGIDYVMQHMYKGYEPIKGLEQLRAFWAEKTEVSDEDLTTALLDQSAKRVIFGHTHLQTVYYFSNQEFCLNPGSLAYGKGFELVEGILPATAAHYITITDGIVEMKSLEYDRDSLMQAIEHAQVSQAAKDRLIYLSLSDYKTFDRVPKKV